MFQLFQHLIPASVLTLLLADAVLLATCYAAAAYVLVDVDPTVFLLYDGGLARILIVVGTIMAGLYFHDLYSQVRVRSRVVLLQQCVQVFGIAFLVQAVVSYVSANWMLPRWVMMSGSGAALATLYGWRLVYSAVVLAALGTVRVLLVGSSCLVREIAEEIAERPQLGMTVAGCYGDEALDGSRLMELVRQTRPDRIVVGVRERRGRLPLDELMELRFSGIRIEEAAAAFEAVCGRVPLAELQPAHLIFSRELGPHPGRVALQSLYSLLLALVGTLLTLPVMILVAAAIKLTSRGPVLFRQLRVGRNGRTFVLYKFRSMYHDAEARTGPVWAAPDDPRVTPVGRWLRRLRLDELPQFFNVLRGDMVLVGPRPERPEFVKVLEAKIPYYRQRHCVKPGITGWAQINHKYGDTVEDAIRKLEYDLYYIKNLSPALDAYILFHTVKTMLLFRGAQ
ncbi:MAG: sugar transferase [Bryobacterales bacterium]|nr:sugar transferase [Bryobacteraceae bacterium]MDW8355613.1 sugar transferase [Bryobacterales bacterium]